MFSMHNGSERVQRVQNANFNPRLAKYACCGQLIHVNTGSLLIATFHISIATFAASWVVRNLLTDNKGHFEASFELTLAIALVLASLLLIIGIRFEQRKMLSVYLVCQVIITALLFILFLALIMGLKAGVLDDPNHDGYNTLEEELLIVVEIFISLGVVCVEVWFLTIVLKSYRFLTDKYYSEEREDDV